MSKLLDIFAVLALCCVFQNASAASVGKLPPSFIICQQGDKKFNACMERAVEKALVVLSNGYRPLGIHSIDPLEVLAIDIDQGTGPVSINLKFRNLKIYGFQNGTLSDMKADVKNHRFVTKVFLPKIDLIGKYTIDGKVLILPITGSGNTYLTLQNVQATVELIGKEFKKDGVAYMKTEALKFTFDTTKLSMKFENLFNGDKALSDNMNRFLNDNWDEILKELKPAVQETFGLAFAEISNRIFTKVPYADIFPQ